MMFSHLDHPFWAIRKMEINPYLFVFRYRVFSYNFPITGNTVLSMIKTVSDRFCLPATSLLRPRCKTNLVSCPCLLVLHGDD